MQGSFSNQILADKLAKLNSTQQSIETLSHWCIFHRRSAKQVVDVWAREFFNAPKEQRVPFLFLANDILQNSRRKGAEFVTEFWRVLPGALKDAMKHGDDSSRSTVLRLIDIWEERRVFGSHAQGLRVELLGKEAPSSAKHNEGLMPEKLVAVYKCFHDKLTDEETVIDKCNTAVIQMESLEKEIDIPSISGQESSAIIIEELQHQEGVLLECAQQLEATEVARSSIVFQLKETLLDQEAKLERTRLLLQAAQSHAEQSRIMQQQIYDAANGHAYQQPVANGSDDSLLSHYNNHIPETSSVSAPHLLSSSTDGYVPTEARVFDPAAAAEVAAKLVASTSSAAMISSVLSSLGAENVVAPLQKLVTQQQNNHRTTPTTSSTPPQSLPLVKDEGGQTEQVAEQGLDGVQEEDDEEAGRLDQEPLEKRQKLNSEVEDLLSAGSEMLLSSSALNPPTSISIPAGSSTVPMTTTVTSTASPVPVAAAAVPVHHHVGVPGTASGSAAAAAASASQVAPSSSAPYLDPTMLLPFSFAGQSMAFPLPVASSQSAPPGCAPAAADSYHQQSTSALSFFASALPRQ